MLKEILKDGLLPINAWQEMEAKLQEKYMLTNYCDICD